MSSANLEVKGAFFTLNSDTGKWTTNSGHEGQNPVAPNDLFAYCRNNCKLFRLCDPRFSVLNIDSEVKSIAGGGKKFLFEGCLYQAITTE